MTRSKDDGFDYSDYYKDPILLPFETAPEDVVKVVVGHAEEYAVKRFGPRVPGGRQYACHPSSMYVRAEASRTRLGLIPLKAPLYQIYDFHDSFGGKVAGDASFGHEFNILDIDGSPFIIDLTFWQFLSPDSGEIQQLTRRSGAVNEHPIIPQLLENGHLPLNDETLRAYMRATTPIGDKSYIDGATVDAVFSNPFLLFANKEASL